MTTTTTTNVSAAVATTLPGTATTTATNTTARRHWRERRAGVPAYIENRTGVFMDTVCTTMTGYDRFSGVYTASTLVEASLGLAIVILIIGACFSEHTKFFAVAFALATILGIVAMSGWANWQNSDGSDFSSSSLTCVCACAPKPKPNADGYGQHGQHGHERSPRSPAHPLPPTPPSPGCLCARDSKCTP